MKKVLLLLITVSCVLMLITSAKANEKAKLELAHAKELSLRVSALNERIDTLLEESKNLEVIEWNDDFEWMLNNQEVVKYNLRSKHE